MDISEREREIYNQIQKKFSDMIPKLKDSNQEDGQFMLQNMFKDIQNNGLDMNKFIMMCTQDPNSVFKIQQANNDVISNQNYVDGPKPDPSMANINTSKKSSEIEGVPDAVCVYRNI